MVNAMNQSFFFVNGMIGSLLALLCCLTNYYFCVLVVVVVVVVDCCSCSCLMRWQQLNQSPPLILLFCFVVAGVTQ